MVEGELVFGEEVEDRVVQTELGILAVAFDSWAELLPAEAGEEGTEHLGKRELVLNSWLQ